MSQVSSEERDLACDACEAAVQLVSVLISIIIMIMTSMMMMVASMMMMVVASMMMMIMIMGIMMMMMSMTCAKLLLKWRVSYSKDYFLFFPI